MLDACMSCQGAKDLASLTNDSSQVLLDPLESFRPRHRPKYHRYSHLSTMMRFGWDTLSLLSLRWWTRPPSVPCCHQHQISQVRHHKWQAQDHYQISHASILYPSKVRDHEAHDPIKTPEHVALWKICGSCFCKLRCADQLVLITIFATPGHAASAVWIFGNDLEWLIVVQEVLVGIRVWTRF